jgi:hypothetical protein
VRELIAAYRAVLVVVEVHVRDLPHCVDVRLPDGSLVRGRRHRSDSLPRAGQ